MVTILSPSRRNSSTRHENVSKVLTARRFVPSTYAIAIGIVYSITLDDGYMGSLDPMFQGLGKVNASGKLAIVPCVLVVIVGTYVLAKRSNCAERMKFLKKQPIHAK